MRKAFIQQLILEARRNPRVFLIVGDLGYSVVEPFAQEFPDRYLNAGVAEQNMTGVAAGLASEGYQVFTYSIANFPTLRCLEQIRNDICYHELDVTIVAVGGGIGYGNLGYSHHAVQDIACLRTLPGITLMLPGTPHEVDAVVRWKADHVGPAYLRLGKGGEPNFTSDQMAVSVGPCLQKEGTGAAVFAVGTAIAWAGPAAVKSGAALYSLPLWQDSLSARQALSDIVANYPRIVVCEEHLQAGGIGSLVHEILESRPELQARVRTLALPEAVSETVGRPEYILKKFGLTEESVLRSLTS